MEFIESLSLKNGYINSYLEEYKDIKTEEFLKETLEKYNLNLEILEKISNKNINFNKSNEDLYVKLENLFDYLGLDNKKLRECITEPLDENIRENINDFNLPKYITTSDLTEEIQEELIKIPSLNFFKYHWEKLKENDKIITSNVEYFKYAQKQDYEWDEYICHCASNNGHLDCLKYAHENGCPWDRDTCSQAAKNGHLDCLKYAHENGCPWDEDTCLKAADNGHLDCLKYTHENGCLWDEDTCLKAAQNNHLDCFNYARENGCPKN